MPFPILFKLCANDKPWTLDTTDVDSLVTFFIFLSLFLYGLDRKKDKMNVYQISYNIKMNINKATNEISL